MRPLKPRNRAPSSYPEPSQEPLLDRVGERRDPRGQWGRGSAGCCRDARGKPISQIIGLDPTVVPRYPAFIRLPDWGRGAKRRRRGSNYGCSCLVAGGGGRRGGPGQAGPAERRSCTEKPGPAARSGGACPRGGPSPASQLCARRKLLRPAGSAAPLFIVESALTLPVPSLAPALPPAPFSPPPERKKSQSVETNES